MGKRTLAGAALASHLAKERGERLPLVGAALTNFRAARPGGRRSEMTGVVGLMARLNKEFPIDEPMKIGDAVVEQFSEVEEIDDVGFQGARWPRPEQPEVLQLRLERDAARKGRKALGRQKIEQRLRDDASAAEFARASAVAHREVTKKRLNTFLLIKDGKLAPIGKKGLKRLKADVLAVQSGSQQSRVAL